jgi:hypothetical protein
MNAYLSIGKEVPKTEKKEVVRCRCENEFAVREDEDNATGRVGGE